MLQHCSGRTEDMTMSLYRILTQLLLIACLVTVALAVTEPLRTPKPAPATTRQRSEQLISRTVSSPSDLFRQVRYVLADTLLTLPLHRDTKHDRRQNNNGNKEENTKEKRRKKATVDEVRRALNTLSTAQQAWQSVDSATHSLKNALGDEHASLEHRVAAFLRKKSRNAKRAAKINEYVSTVERGMQGLELLQTVSSGRDGRRRRLRRSCGLREVAHFSVCDQTSQLACDVFVLVPLSPAESDNDNGSGNDDRYAQHEVLVCVVDRSASGRPTASDPLRVMKSVLALTVNEKPVQLPLRAKSSARSLHLNARTTAAAGGGGGVCSGRVSRGGDSDKSGVCSVQGTVLSLASQLVNGLSPVIFYHSFSVRRNESGAATAVVRHPLKIRLVGHAVGGSVAAVAAMLLDGVWISPATTSTTLSSATSTMSTSSSTTVRTVPRDRHRAVVAGTDIAQELQIVGGFSQRVQCVTFGALPCVSRQVVPKFVLSLVCGDDWMTRCTRSALRDLEDKVTKALASGAGRRGISWLATPSILGKVARKCLSAWFKLVLIMYCSVLSRQDSDVLPRYNAITVTLTNQTTY
jgi:hypothetical protein